MHQQIDYGFLEVGKGKKPDRIFYETSGEGRPLVMIHAGFVDRRMWDNQFEFFAEKGFRVIRYDVRGFGKSDIPSSEYSDFLDLKELLDHLSVKKAVIMGISNGGRITLDFAIEFPEMVEAMILVNSGASGYKSSGPQEDELVKEVEERYKLQEKLVKIGKYRDAIELEVDIWDHTLTNDARERLTELAKDNYHLMKKFPWELQHSPTPPAFERLHSIDVASMVVIGENDVEASQAASKRIQSMIRNSKLSVLPKAGHIANLYNQDKFNQLILDFLRDL